MYTQFFQLNHAPFSISPDPRYLFMSERHREALAHLLYGIDSGGGLVLLTGDIGTGKTTICRCFLEQVPANCNVAYIFNPKLTVAELLQSICEEFHIELPRDERRAAGAKDYIDALNRYLLTAHAQGRNNVLIIDEAQNLSADVLEQLRLLTNLETNERKLLQIILIGQPELRAMLARPELEQLAQRVIAHYHLSALSEQETASYIQHRLTTAGLTTASPFQQPLMQQIHRLTRGVPRRINLLCDRALLGAYAQNAIQVDRHIVDQAARELFIHQEPTTLPKRGRWRVATVGMLAAVMISGAAAWALGNGMLRDEIQQRWAALKINREQQIPTTAALSVPSPPKEPSGVILPEQPGTASHALRDEAIALRALATRWGATLGEGNPCDVAKHAGLRCHKGSYGFAELRQLDRPAVLKLYDTESKPSYAMLIGLGEDNATLHAGEIRQTVPITTLARHFRGEFVTFWRPPPEYTDTVTVSDKGLHVDWIAAQLARLGHAEVPPAGQPFDQKTQERVRRFQQVNGLFVDGVVGPATLMHLNRAAGLEEPRLHKGLTAMREYALSGE